MMQMAAKQLDLSLQTARLAIEHNQSSGQALEAAIRVFLRKHLPASLGITQGQIVDVAGNVSKQLDVIVYDTQSTPMLFTSEEQGHQLVPIEGVIGIVEVKTSVSASTLPGIIENMQSIKTMEKTAYHRRNSPQVISSTYNMFGLELAHFPIIYSLFAFESSTFENLVPEFRTLNDAFPPHQRIDNTCLLNQGVIANGTPEGKLDAIPNPSTRSLALETDHALLTWYIMIQRLYSQATPEPINMQAYLGKDFYF